MSLRKIVKFGDKVLREPTREVSKISKKIKVLINDMYNTMYANNGVGLAAPQVGENLRIFVIDVSAQNEPLNPIAFINPKIIKKSGAIISQESCLSFPNAFANVRRYKYVMVKALDINGKPFVIEANDGTLLARAIQHEFDHLNGILFVDHTIDVEATQKELQDKGFPSLELDKLLDESEMDAEIEESPENND